MLYEETCILIASLERLVKKCTEIARPVQATSSPVKFVSSLVENKLSFQYPGQLAHLGGVVEWINADKDESARLRASEEENRHIKYVSVSTSSVSPRTIQNNISSDFNENIKSQEDMPAVIENTEPGTSRTVIRKDFITPMLDSVTGERLDIYS